MRKSVTYVRGAGLGPLLVRAVAGSGSIQIIGILVTFLAGVQLARGLGVSGFGNYGTVIALITVASIPSEFGLSKLVLREVAAAKSRGDMADLFGILRWADRTCYAISAVTVVLLVAATPIFLGGFTSDLGKALLFGLAMVPLMPLIRIRGGALQGLHFVVLGRTPENLLRPAFLSGLLAVLFLGWPKAGLAGAMAVNSLAAAGAFLFAHAWLRSRLPPAPDQRSERKRDWLRSSLPMAAADAMRLVQLQLAILILAAATSPAEVGLFRISVSICTVVAAPGMLINSALFPFLARFHAEQDQARLQLIVSRGAQAQFAGTLLLGAPLLFAGKPLLTLVFGAQYAPAAGPLAILVVGQIINAAFGPNAPLLNMTGHERRVTRALVISVTMMMIAILMLGRTYGAIGAALGTIVSIVIWNLITFLDAKRLLGISTLAFATGKR